MVAGLGGCGDSLSQLAAGEQGRVAYVRSGDTLVLDDGVVVRLAGIDAPSWDEPFGREAAAALTRMTAGREVELFYGGARRDSYGRALSHVRLKNGRVWLQHKLLQDGAAWVRTYPDNRALAAPMLAAEAKARLARRGLWSIGDYQVRLPMEAQGQTGFMVLEGRVTGAYDAAGAAELDLDDIVTARIPQGEVRGFWRAGRDPGRLKGRLVRVRGYLSRDRSLRLDHPEQLEVLRDRRSDARRWRRTP